MNPIFFLFLAALLLQDPAPQQQTPPPPDTAQQQREAEAQRRLQLQQEQEEARRERERRALMNAMDLSTKPARLRYAQLYIAPVMKHDPEFDLTSLPIADWLQAQESAEIPWKVEVKDSALRMDQRLEVAYTAKIQAKSLNKLGSMHDLVFISGISSADRTAEWLAEPKVVRYEVEKDVPEDLELRFSDSVFTQPGTYQLWLILHDGTTMKHSVEKRRIEVSPLDNDPLPHVSDRLPQVDFPRQTDREGGTVLEFNGGLSLPVPNKRPVRVELISVLSPPEQWNEQRNMLRSHNEMTVAALNTLAQLQFAQGSISLTGLDISHRTVPFEQKDFESLNWRGLAEAIDKTDTSTVSAAILQEGNKGGVAFFSDWIHKHLADPGRAEPVLIVVSSGLLFGPGSKAQPMKLEGDCRCRVYHLRFRHSLSDVFDDIEKVLKPLRPKTFNLAAPRDFRKALAAIIQDLTGL